MKENKITQHANLIALFAGLVFVSHPLQTEAVTYILQRAASMATLFYLAPYVFMLNQDCCKKRVSFRGLVDLLHLLFDNSHCGHVH